MEDGPDPEYQPHDIWLTRERTEAVGEGVTLPTLPGVTTPRAKKEVTHRRAYLQLDLLNPGDVFVSHLLSYISDI